MQIETIDDIKTVLPYRDRLEVLAEEASELTQAALKVIRAAGFGFSVCVKVGLAFDMEFFFDRCKMKPEGVHTNECAYSCGDSGS